VRVFCRARSLDPIEWALHSGEDYALILSVAPKSVAAACRAIGEAGVRASVIGRFTRERGAHRIIDAAGHERAFRAGGWDHLRKGRR
jgi:thiamine monophosphate kinase